MSSSKSGFGATDGDRLRPEAALAAGHTERSALTCNGLAVRVELPPFRFTELAISGSAQHHLVRSKAEPCLPIRTMQPIRVVRVPVRGGAVCLSIGWWAAPLPWPAVFARAKRVAVTWRRTGDLIGKRQQADGREK